MLAGVHAAELQDKLLHLFGHGPHDLALLRLGEVYEGSDMQAPNRRVAVKAGCQAVGVQDLAKPSGVVGQPGRFDGSILHERQRPPGPGARRHQQPEASLADLEQRRLLHCAGRSQCVVPVPAALPRLVQPVKPGHRLRQAVAEERDEEQRVRITCQDRAERPVLDLGAGQVQDGTVHQLDCRRFAGQGGFGGLDGLLGGPEVADRDHSVSRCWHQVNGGLGDGHQRSFRAGHYLGEVEQPRVASAPGQPVEPVPARLPPKARVTGRDRVGVPQRQLRQFPVKRPLQGRRRRQAGPLLPGDRAERRVARIRQHHVERAHVVDRHAVAHRMTAGRVVADHSADRGPVRRRGVGAEQQPAGGGGHVQLLLHDAWLNPGGSGFGVDVKDPVHMPGEVHHDGGTDGLPGQARPGPPGQHRHPGRRRDADHGRHIGRVARKHDSDRLDRVHAGIPRIQVPGVLVELDLAGHRRR